MIKRSHGRSTKLLTSCLFYFSSVLILVSGYDSLSWSAGEKYPDRPINMVVGFSPGGALDLGSKVLGDKIAEVLGEPLISLYKPGGGGSLGAALVAKAKPDGYTILASAPSIHANATLVKKVDFNYYDLVPVGRYGIIPYFFIVKGDAPWKSLKDFTGDAKKSPGSFKVGILGTYTNGDFICRLLNRHAEIELTRIPFKSSAEILTALLGGHVEAALTTGAAGLSESGKIRILATATEHKLAGLPNVPSFKELGYPIVIRDWNCLFFPKGTPKEILKEFCQAQESAIKHHRKEIEEKLRRAEIWADFLSHQETMEEYKKSYQFYREFYQQVGLVPK
jgi:tripartite-type tricarboxylate transporter receptor subunit TctC